jgi:AcrR family transcriptional regulator
MTRNVRALAGENAPPFVPPPTPKTSKSAGTRRRLLELASRLIIERGYSAVSMQDIASAAELTKGAVYGHFRSKGQLLVEVIRSEIAASDEATDYLAVRADADRGVALLHSPRNRSLRLLEVDAAAAARHDPDVAAGLLSLYSDRHSRIRDAVKHLKDPDATAWLIAVLSAGVGMRESAGLPAPESERLNAVLNAALHNLPTDVAVESNEAL